MKMIKSVFGDSDIPQLYHVIPLFSLFSSCSFNYSYVFFKFLCKKVLLCL